MPHHITWFCRGKRIIVRDKMQRRYSYTLAEDPGKNFSPDFKPQLSPARMLALGVFEGKYMNDCIGEFPIEWFARGKFSRTADPRVNLFRVKSRLSLQEWRHNGWIIGHDPRGWFQWYCRYWLGRRDPKIDDIQIKRWRAFVRHRAQVAKSISTMPAHRRPRTMAQYREHRPRQRQALLQWAYNPFDVQ